MISLYVHIPFCLQKCNYCAFYSLPLAGGQDDYVFPYLQALEREIELRHNEAPSGVFSLFLGGGTPTVLAGAELKRLLEILHSGFDMKAAEKTAEANPGTLDRNKLATLISFGINRLSLGAQSFNDLILKRIGRVHTAKDIMQGVRLVREAGIDNLNLDLIFGLPGQTMTDWQDSLQKAVSLSPEHLSLYALTIEEGTPLAGMAGGQERILFPDEDLQADMYEWAVEYLSREDYRRYEVSNFARPGRECRHNLACWQGKDYLGLGPGAVSSVKGLRTKNIEKIESYQALLSSGSRPLDPAQTEHLSLKQQISEYIMLGFRTARGVDLEDFTAKFKMNMQDIYGHKLANYINRKILIEKNGTIRINPSFLFTANSIIQDFIL